MLCFLPPLFIYLFIFNFFHFLAHLVLLPFDLFVAARVSCFCFFSKHHAMFVFRGAIQTPIIIFHGSTCMAMHHCVYSRVLFLLTGKLRAHCAPWAQSSPPTRLSGSRGPCSVWSEEAPWLIYFLPGTTALSAGQRRQGLPEAIK